MRVATMLAVAGLLAGCSTQPAPRAEPENDAAAANGVEENLADALPAAPEKRSYVGRWASKPELCATAAWTFTEKHVDTPDGISCDFDTVQERPGGYDMTATCGSGPEKRTETIALRFTVSTELMMVDSKLFRPAGLEQCKGDAGVMTVPVPAVDNSD